MNQVTIRKFNNADAPALVTLHEQNSRWFEEGFMSEDFILMTAARDDFQFFVAQIEAEIVGYAGVLFFENVGRAEFGPIIVADHIRRAKIGSKLLAHAVGFLKRNNIQRLITRVKDNNTQAMRFFKVNGFDDEATLKNYTRFGEDALQMVQFI